MIELNEPQVWTLIAVFAAGMFGMLTLMSTMFTRMMSHGFDGLRAEMGSLRGEMGSLRGEMGSLRTEMNTRFEAVDARFEAIDSRFDHLDRDVQALVRRVFPEYPETG